MLLQNIAPIIELAQAAGQAVLEVYDTPQAEVTHKDDHSPLTQADLRSHRCIVEGLSAITQHYPVLSEESSARDIAERLDWPTYWLIDPLDGTKEFIKRNGEFTVNIALIHQHQAVAGVVHAPALGLTWYGQVGHGAHKVDAHGHTQTICVRPRPANPTDWRLVGSRSHASAEFNAFMGQYPAAQLVSMGSSIKLCLVAEGSADLYPRLGPTSEWDTAAAHAVVEAAGGQVLAYPDLEPLRYNTNHKSLLNPHFLVCATPL
jgi:3'(2'), 5'-bisphosphate nucleotidase